MPHEERAVRFMLRLSGNNLMISAPDTVFAGTPKYKVTTSFELPVRLVDLSNFSATARDVRLYVPKEGEEGKYVALSYCWGYSQPVTTTKGNLLRHLRKIPYDNLPQTLQDAVNTTKAVGIRFLWVDALCIIQDSERDKQTKIAKMVNIFQNAHFTMVVACSTSSAEGFLQVRDGIPPALEIPIGCGNGKDRQPCSKAKIRGSTARTATRQSLDTARNPPIATTVDLWEGLGGIGSASKWIGDYIAGRTGMGTVHLPA
ncbi:hypothetical protein G6011_02552 [Alternaria panax]|uniref:Heterokaryon incompatibility domain-containing protein n=1 Tax=Alternaria panax TaxID=48097 RepID=A0AAD4I6Z7_9PLEO|nr:hypothetical protein G6011_02552 [Alternaria panax]